LKKKLNIQLHQFLKIFCISCFSLDLIIFSGVLFGEVKLQK